MSRAALSNAPEEVVQAHEARRPFLDAPTGHVYSAPMPTAGRANRRNRAWALAVLLLASPWLGGCSLRKLAVRTAANALTTGTSVYATDDDPELVEAALPFALKTLEGFLAQDPGNQKLLLAASSGFAQYSFAFLHQPAKRLETEDYARSRELTDRAVRLYLRARDYALRGLTARHPHIEEELRRDPIAAAAALEKEDLPLAYWTAASWGAAINIAKDRTDLLADLPAVRALTERGLALDEAWSEGALHELMLAIESATPQSLGGSAERTKQHYERAVALSGGHNAGVYVSYAQFGALPAQDRAAFEDVLHKALEVDVDAVPERRLANVLAQRQASWLLEQADNLFLGEESPEEQAPDTEDTSSPPTEPSDEPPPATHGDSPA